MKRFGFSFAKGGAHTSRTLMLNELSLLFSYKNNSGTSKSEYLRAVVEENCLNKRSGRTRSLTGRHLVDLYALDSETTIFRALKYYWDRDKKGQAMLALLCAYSRDPVLKQSAPFILKTPEGARVVRETLEEYIEQKEPGRFSKATLKSTAQNLNATWTKSGHLTGKVKKIRSVAEATPGAVSYALFLGYLSGARGKELFNTEYTRLLDCHAGKAIELAEEASRRGWIVFKRVADVIEALFDNNLTEQEREWVRE